MRDTTGFNLCCAKSAIRVAFAWCGTCEHLAETNLKKAYKENRDTAIAILIIKGHLFLRLCNKVIWEEKMKECSRYLTYIAMICLSRSQHQQQLEKLNLNFGLDEKPKVCPRYYVGRYLTDYLRFLRLKLISWIFHLNTGKNSSSPHNRNVYGSKSRSKVDCWCVRLDLFFDSISNGQQ